MALSSEITPFTAFQTERKTHSTILLLVSAIGVIVVFHLIGIGSYPLLGTTEGRYAEMAKKMVLAGQYLVPMFTDSEPFWGKPPLSMWITAASMHLFGINEFAARLPSWLSSIGVGLLIVRLLAPDTRAGLFAFLIWTGSYLGYAAFGKVHTDSILTLCVTLALVGLYIGHTQRAVFWQAVAYIGLGLGLLAKGPVVAVYIGMPWCFWLLLQRQFIPYVTSLSTWLGIGAACAIAVPWYIAAEAAYPGFLDYFLVGEHFQRFLDPGWSADLYGAGHHELPGTIVIFLAESLLPWSLLLPILYLVRKKRRGSVESAHISFLVIWAIVPVLFFCASANVVPNYVMPTIPAWVALLSIALIPFCYKRRQVIALALFAGLFPFIKLIQNANPASTYDEPRNQQALVRTFLESRTSEPLFFAGKRLYAAEFYFSDINYAMDEASLPHGAPYYLAMRSGREPFPNPSQCQEKPMTNNYRLFYCEP